MKGPVTIIKLKLQHQDQVKREPQFDERVKHTQVRNKLPGQRLSVITSRLDAA